MKKFIFEILRVLFFIIIVGIPSFSFACLVDVVTNMSGHAVEIIETLSGAYHLSSMISDAADRLQNHSHDDHARHHSTHADPSGQSMNMVEEINNCHARQFDFYDSNSLLEQAGNNLVLGIPTQLESPLPISDASSVIDFVPTISDTILPNAPIALEVQQDLPLSSHLSPPEAVGFVESQVTSYSKTYENDLRYNDAAFNNRHALDYVVADSYVNELSSLVSSTPKSLRQLHVMTPNESLTFLKNAISLTDSPEKISSQILLSAGECPIASEILTLEIKFQLAKFFWDRAGHFYEVDSPERLSQLLEIVSPALKACCQKDNNHGGYAQYLSSQLTKIRSAELLLMRERGEAGILDGLSRSSTYLYTLTPFHNRGIPKCDEIRHSYFVKNLALITELCKLGKLKEAQQLLRELGSKVVFTPGKEVELLSTKEYTNLCSAYLNFTKKQAILHEETDLQKEVLDDSAKLVLPTAEKTLRSAELDESKTECDATVSTKEISTAEVKLDSTEIKDIQIKDEAKSNNVTPKVTSAGVKAQGSNNSFFNPKDPKDKEKLKESENKREIILPKVKTYEQARNQALEIIGEVDVHTGEKIIGRIGIGKGKVVGRRWHNGKVTMRLDYDPNKGPHINVTDYRVAKGVDGKSIAIPFEGTIEIVQALLKPLQ